MIIKSNDLVIRKMMKQYKQQVVKEKKIITTKNIWNQLEEMGNFNRYNVIETGNFNGVNNAWENEPCFVVGAGKSLNGFDFEKLNGFHTIGINHTIEDYDKFEWFIFLDDRFLKMSLYKIENYKGKVFSQNNCRLLPFNDCVRFKALIATREVSKKIQDGLYNNRMTGIAALNLAIIAGANPIYLLGFDCGIGTGENYHYKEDYTGADKNESRRVKYVNSARFFDKFEQYSDRIINLSKESNITTFKKMRFKDIKIKKKRIEIKQEPIICHIGTMMNIDQMGTISREVFYKTNGKHIYTNLDAKYPKADIYLLECFLNGADKYRNFKRPYKNSKVISLIHSCGRCLPSIDTDEIVTITYTWKGIMQQNGYDSKMIYAGIEPQIYNKRKNYKNKTFGRITRYSRGKVHPEWINIVNRILDEQKDSECHIISSNYPDINRDRLHIYRDIKINEEEKKAKYLAKINIFADAHNTFKETFSLCLLEAMASGCMIILLKGQEAMEEIIGNAGLICYNIEEFENIIKRSLLDSELMKEMGKKAKKRAKEFTIERMIFKWNQLFKGILNG